MSSPTAILTLWCDNEKPFLDAVRFFVQNERDEYPEQTKNSLVNLLAIWIRSHFNGHYEEIDGPYCTLLQYALDAIDYRGLAEHLIRRLEENK
jgi:hypothetical protein